MNRFSGHAENMISEKCLKLLFVCFWKWFKLKAAAFSNETIGQRLCFSGCIYPHIIDNFARQFGQVKIFIAHKNVHLRILQLGVIIGQVFQRQPADTDVDQSSDRGIVSTHRSACGVLGPKTRILALFQSHRVGPRDRLLWGCSESGHIPCLRYHRRGRCWQWRPIKVSLNTYRKFFVDYQLVFWWG